MTCLFSYKQSIKEPFSDSLEQASDLEFETGRRSGMLQYLQSWFPGWGGWYSESQTALEKDTFEELLSETQEQWRPDDITGKVEFIFPFEMSVPSCQNLYQVILLVRGNALFLPIRAYRIPVLSRYMH